MALALAASCMTSPPVALAERLNLHSIAPLMDHTVTCLGSDEGTPKKQKKKNTKHETTQKEINKIPIFPTSSSGASLLRPVHPKP